MASPHPNSSDQPTQGDKMLIPEDHLDLLKDETKAFLYLATIMKDGTPQITPIWFNSDGTYILINSSKGRVKDRNMRLRPDVALVIQDPKSAYRYIQVRGKVVEITEVGADEHINDLSLKYHGKPWTKTPNQVRVIYKILPEHVDAH
jgi:PPOX class probable F420-dependent enzyme